MLIEEKSKYDWIQPNIKAWMQSVILFPVEIQILDVNEEEEKALIKSNSQEGWIDFDRLYKTESECPIR